MKCEEEFDERRKFSELEATALSGGAIRPITRVFYKPLGQFYHPKGDRTRRTEEAEETTQEAIQEAERIHQKYRKN